MSNTILPLRTAAWNLVTGCTQISAGCQNCCAATCHCPNNFSPTIHEEALYDPYRWWKNWRISLPGMGDLFQEDIPFDFIHKTVDTITRCTRHTFMLQTKRARRMYDYFSSYKAPDNLWLGVAVEDESTVWRIDYLRQLDASVRFISCEPLLEAVFIPSLSNIDWLIVGGETGSKGRKMEKSWVLDLQDQCDVANVPFFFKQWGTWGSDGVKRSVKANGCLLDGKEYHAYPTPRTTKP